MKIYNDVIDTWKKLHREICWNAHQIHDDFYDLGNGLYCIDKLYISPDEVSYKTSTWKLAPDVYQKFLKFLELFDVK